MRANKILTEKCLLSVCTLHHAQGIVATARTQGAIMRVRPVTYIRDSRLDGNYEYAMSTTETVTHVL